MQSIILTRIISLAAFFRNPFLFSQRLARGGRPAFPRRSMPDEAPATDPSLQAPKRLPVLLRRAWYGLNQAFRQRVHSLKITPDQFSILRWLSEGDPQGLTQRTITDLMASDPNTITSTLVRMEKNGLIERRPHETDRRAHRVRLLPKGRRTFEKARKVAMELQTGILESLREEERARFLNSMEIIADACAAATERPARKRPDTQ
jgi:DNA-binding MarR family transcriptional regulator